MIDTHSHLNFQAFKDDYRQVIGRSLENGIEAINNIGSNFLTSQKAVQIARELEVVAQHGREATLRCFAAIGLHPIHVQDEEFNLEKWRQLVKENKDLIKAIGETGLDYYHGEQRFLKQKEVLSKHLALAQEFNLPIILHCRSTKEQPLKAYQDLLSIIHNSKFMGPGVIHCFAANWSMAQEFLSQGFYIGFTGIITYPNAGPDLLEVVVKTPLNRILLETDCPYLAPQPWRGQRCEPWHVKYTAEKIAEIRNITLEEVEQQTKQNARQLFRF